MALFITFFTAFLTSLFVAAQELPSQPIEQEHPGSNHYEYDVEIQSLKVDGRQVDVFLPKGNQLGSFPVIVFGHGQAIKVSAYADSFKHFAKKGVAVIHPNYDSGFFDQNWERMASDYNELTHKTIQKFEQRLDRSNITYSGHSKGGYVALMAAGTSVSPVRPSSLVLFAPADFNSSYLSSLDINVPLTLIWGENDSIIGRDKIQQIYNQAPSLRKQFIEVKSYSSLSADHYLPMTKSSFFGGHDGANAFHYHGMWKWLIGASQDVTNKSNQTNTYIYGSEAYTSGAGFKHAVQRSWQNYEIAKVSGPVVNQIQQDSKADIVVYLKSSAEISSDISAAESIVVRAERVRFVQKKLVNNASTSQEQIVKHLLASGIQHKAFYIENAIAIANASLELIQWLSNREEVEHIGLDAKAELKLPEVSKGDVDASVDVPSHLQIIKADKVWDEFKIKGQGIVVAGQDTGYLWNHNAIKRQYRGNQKGTVDHNYHWHDAFLSCQYEPCDDHGHGTHTMGTIVGDDGGSNKIGVAPEAQWIACRNMLNGVGTVSSYLSCFEFFLAPYPANGDPRKDGRPELAPHIVNNSWSCPPKEGCTGGEFLDSIRAMNAAGIAVVAAASNDGPNCESVDAPPAYYSEEVFTVGAYNRYQKKIAFFSSLGPSTWDGGLAPDLIAPGTLIRSAVNSGVNSYTDKAGTSMAAPHVAGAIALLWSANPQLIGQLDLTYDILRKTATPMTGGNSCKGFPSGQVPNAVYGYGMLDVHAAVKKALE